MPAVLLELQGLSPRTRGNPLLILTDLQGAGSIPAHAGEPLAGSWNTAEQRVYPRARGGTSGITGISLSTKGLSPRTRGNRGEKGPLPRLGGSIPAHAGEPK
mgnify:CR=1 FL=1